MSAPPSDPTAPRPAPAITLQWSEPTDDVAVGQPADPLLLDSEGLRRLASERIVRRGIAYFKEERVIELGWKGQQLWATVEGSVANQPYQVDIGVDQDGELTIECSCPFDWEPACKHAVAALLAYAARQQLTSEQVQSAADEAVAERRRRGRTEVLVEHLAGEPTFGTWTARSIQPTGFQPRTYQVELRSLSDRINHCTCPDFATNRLGTCKHIEAVLHTLRAKPGSCGAGGRGHRKVKAHDGAGSEVAAPAVSVVHLDWSAPRPPQVRIRRAPEVEARLARRIDEAFDAAGNLRGELPDALFRFRQRVADRSDEVYVSADALDHAQRIAEVLAQRERARRIREEIRRSGGRLEGVRAQLYPYQVEGVAFLASTGRALLADDMGLGKTLQAISAASWLLHNEGLERVLVVCPASLKHQWAREVERFTGKEAVVIQGPPPERLARYRQGAPYTIINYELLLRDHTQLIEELAPDLLVLDEAQRIRNWRTKTADSIKALQTRYAFVLTGTPLENRLEDLYSLMQVVDRRVLGPLWQFLLEFHITDDRGKVLGYRNLSELRRRLQPVMLRRHRSVVRDQLPERIVQRLDVPLTPRQRELHDEGLATAGALAARARKRPLTPSEHQRLMAALQVARMACDCAGLVDGETRSSPKLDELGRLLEELCLEGGRKVVVFSQWERMTALAEDVARGLGLGTVRLHGGVPSGSRGELLRRFAEDPSVQVFLSTDAGGVGLNLQSASALINLDIPYNPAVLDQRMARIHRLGQKESTLLLLLVAQGSYEERVHAIVESKRHLFINVVEEDASEDVVGISRRSIELAMEALGLPDDAEREAGNDDEEEPPAQQAPAEESGAPGEDEDAAVVLPSQLAPPPRLSPAADEEAEEAKRRAPAGEPGEGDRGKVDGGDVVPAEREVLEQEAEQNEGGEDADEEGGEPAAEDDPAMAGEEEQRPDGRPGEAPRPVHDPEVVEVVVQLQRAFGRRLERVVAAGGGLLAVVEELQREDQEVAVRLSDGIEVAVVDARAFDALRRMRVAGVESAPAAWQRPQGESEVAAEPPGAELLRLARRKLVAAELLVEQGCLEEAAGLFAAAMISAAAGRTGADEPPADDALPVWLYSELLPAGVLDADQAGQVLRAAALSRARAIPQLLVEQVRAEAQELVARCEAGRAV